MFLNSLLSPKSKKREGNMFQKPSSNTNTVTTSKDMVGNNDNTNKTAEEIQWEEEKKMQSKKHKEQMCN